MSVEALHELLVVRLKEVRMASPGVQDRLARRAWEMVQRDVPWYVVLSATRISAGPGQDDSGCQMPGGIASGEPEAEAVATTAEDQTHLNDAGEPARRQVDERDLAMEPAPPLRHEVGRYERERLSANTRQAIRMARHARRWHEIRKMRSVLMNIDQAYLKRMLGAESDTLNQEINTLLRSWAPLVRDRHAGGRDQRRHR